MIVDDILRVLIVGPMGAGKSQICNFVQKDLTNSINRVSPSLVSCTQNPKSNIFERIGKKFDFIDTAGNNERDEIEIANLRSLVNYLKNLKKIHFIILVLKFGERLFPATKEYIEALGKIFTVREFFCHLCVVFTKFPNNPDEDDLKTKEIINSEINTLLKNTFQPQEIDNLPNNEIFYINTKNVANGDIYRKNQDIMDKILRKIVNTQQLNNPINTENLDITGANAKLRREKELELLRKKIEEEKRLRQIAEDEAWHFRSRAEEMEMEAAKERKFKEGKRIENKKREEEKQKIYDDMRGIRHTGEKLLDLGTNISIGSVGLGILGAILTPVCPVGGTILIGLGAGGGVTGVAGVKLGGSMCTYAQNEERNLESQYK